MTYKIIIQANVACPNEEVIGAKEAIAETLEGIGCDVDHIRVMPNLSEELNESNQT